MKNLLKLVLLTAFVVMCGTISAQQIKLGHINSQELITAMPEFDSVQVKLETYSTELRQQLEEISVEFNTKFQKFQKEQATYTASVRAQKEKELQDINARLQQFQQDAQDDFETVRRELMSPVMSKADEAIKKVAAANGFTAVFDSAGGSLLYTDPKTMTDVMPLVKTELKINK